MDIFLSDYLSHTSSLLGIITYPAADATVVLTAMYFVIRDKHVFSTQLASPFSYIVCALLVVLAASHYSGRTRTLNQVASFALPFLAAHPSGHAFFQLANAFGIYRLLHSNDSLLTSALCVLLHMCLVLANLDLSSQTQLKTIISDVSFAQVRHLNYLQKLRKLTIDDLWPVPERFQLCDAYAELEINTNESLFLIRAIIRMVWRPMIPIYIAGMLFELLPIFKTMLNGFIYQCLDSADGSAYYKAYMAAAGLILAEFLDAQKCHLVEYIDKEKARVKNALELELVRKPLVQSGLKNVANNWEIKTVGALVNSVQKLQDVIPYMFGTLATVIPIYRQVGWYAFIPLAVSSSVNTFEWAFKRLMGSAYDWDPSCGFYEGDTVGNIYFSIKTIKMFGWERMYMDPKIRKNRESFKVLPWYAPVVLFVFRTIRIATMLTTDLSMYITLVMYLKTLPYTEYAMTNSRLLEMTEHIDSVRWNALRIARKLGNVSSLINLNTKLEHLFRGETFNTISYVKLGEPETVPLIHLDNCSFRWKKNPCVLKQVTLNATSGELVAVVGKTGSGKTSLLLAMCRELEMTKGSGKIVGRIGYMEQSPWIMNDTMRANILFGRDFDEEYYWKVIHACALSCDLESWPNSDLTMIGERGINISGGQRARLALARTVYSQANVYILDDPLSAVDAHVKRHILDNVILSSGLLGDKLRVITTHSESILQFCSQVVTVGDKTVSAVHQEPKEHLYIVPAIAANINDECDPTITGADSNSMPTSPIIDNAAQSITPEDASSQWGTS